MQAKLGYFGAEIQVSLDRVNKWDHFLNIELYCFVLQKLHVLP